MVFLIVCQTFCSMHYVLLFIEVLFCLFWLIEFTGFGFLDWFIDWLIELKTEIVCDVYICFLCILLLVFCSAQNKSESQFAVKKKVGVGNQVTTETQENKSYPLPNCLFFPPHWFLCTNFLFNNSRHVIIIIILKTSDLICSLDKVMPNLSIFLFLTRCLILEVHNASYYSVIQLCYLLPRSTVGHVTPCLVSCSLALYFQAFSYSHCKGIGFFDLWHTHQYLHLALVIGNGDELNLEVCVKLSEIMTQCVIILFLQVLQT